MRTRGIVLAMVLVLFGFAGEARAWTAFGTVEDIHPIENVGLTGPDGEALFLGYKTSTVYFIGGAWITDDGYILGLQSDHSRILDMPTGETLAGFQKQGLLPDPLPGYSVGFLAYLKGYSLWLALLVLIGGYAALMITRRSMRPHI